MGTQEIVISVGGMDCDGCVRTVTRALESVSGQGTATVDLATGRAVVRSTTDAANLVMKLVSAVTDAGYEARPG